MIWHTLIFIFGAFKSQYYKPGLQTIDPANKVSLLRSYYAPGIACPNFALSLTNQPSSRCLHPLYPFLTII